MQLPWHQLTKLHVGFIDIPSFFQVLRNSTNLVQASFEFDSESLALPVSNFGHPRLRCLALGMCDLDEDERAVSLTLLDYLEIPDLIELIVVLPYHPVVHKLSPLLSFLSHPTLRLQTLALSFPYLPPTETMENMMECLKLASSLAHFKFHSPSLVDIDILFARLTGHADFLPKLEHLQLSFFDNPSFALTMSLLIGMLCWRWAAVGIAQLKSFRLTCEPPLASFFGLLKSESEFRRLGGEGMMLYVGRTQETDEFWDFLKTRNFY
ncbi:hypothetical protein C8F04DRAFT_1116838 [Mycena alexandri]|uniref:Uncharacterized protein n=1 Tax=Mycena alexandri TaxID=1745969 RepID=A0AAD6WXZ1_9AGAR|nr:hypothetical protein C8F04DRAFT_1116838 [Mycena alexandri]